MASVDHLTPEAAIARITDWDGLDVTFEVLGGGITNHNYIVTVAGRPDLPWGGKYVMRIPGQGTDTFIDRDREHLNHIAAAEAGVTPPILHTLEPEMCTVVPFIEGETMHPEDLAGHRDRLGKVVDVIHAYHEKATFANEIDVFSMIREYMKMARDVDAPLPEDIDWMLDLGDQIEQAMQRDAPPPAACHNDLLSENFILDTGGTMWVIDWEYGGMTDPYFDLGDFCVEHPLSDDEERFIISRYCGAMQEDRFARMMLYKLVADLWWSIWAMIQVRLSKIDFDFYEYGMNRVARFHANAARPEFPSWLATVQAEMEQRMNDEVTRPAGEVGPDVGMGKVDPEMARQFQEEALRVVNAGEEKGVHLRVIGALAFWHHCPQFGYIQEKLNRVYTDIDFAGYGKQSKQIREFFVSIGYDEDLEINAFHSEGGRLIFNNPTNHIHVDVFMDKLDFCHPIPWKGRLEVDSPTIPLAEMLLEKMQIVKINEKDIIDTMMLLLEHEIDANDEDKINSARVSKLCAGEWGLWRTTSMNLEKVRDYLPHVDLEDEHKEIVTKRVAELLSAMDDYPKGTKWKLRARVGDKVRWYNVID